MPTAVLLASGTVFGRLTVHSDSSLRTTKGAVLWQCICACGAVVLVDGYKLRNGLIKSCGCGKLLQITEGAVYGNLTTLREERTLLNARAWLCFCLCGRTKIVTASDLARGVVKSCGCLQLKHGEAKSRTKDPSPEWRAWSAMRYRCTNENSSLYEYYGGRGITIDPRWDEFALFLKDMGRRSSPTHSLDRIDNDGSYTPSNCRWATKKVQANNRRSRRRPTLIGGVHA